MLVSSGMQDYSNARGNSEKNKMVPNGVLGAPECNFTFRLRIGGFDPTPGCVWGRFRNFVFFDFLVAKGPPLGALYWKSCSAEH